MTVIAALHQNGETWIGCDGLVSSGNGDRFPGSICKWNFSDDGRSAIASAGHTFTRNLLAEQTSCGPHLPRTTTGARILAQGGVVAIVRSLRQLFKDNDLDRDHDKRWPNEFIIVCRDGIFDVAGDSSIHEIPHGTLWARGSGENYAIAAGFALRGDNPMARMRIALETACEFNKGCGGDLFIHRLGDPLADRQQAA